MHCTFCIVPQTRGAERSRSIGEIVAEVRDLVSRGVKEVTLLGQIVNLYGRHEFPKVDNKSPFVQLLEAVHEVEGLERLRFTSPHPIGFRDDLIDAISRLPETCRARSSAVAIRLEQDSESDAPRVHRGEIFRSGRAHPAGAQWRLRLPPTSSSGFPARRTTTTGRHAIWSRKSNSITHFVFRYSPRRDTPAAEMPDQIDEHLKEQRNQDLLEVVNKSNRRILERLVGSQVEVLCEGPSKTNRARLMGRTRTNKIVVFPPSPKRRPTGESEELVGELVNVRIERANGFSLYGMPLLE